jgi:potassium voltage-gated channel Eag-related subfamily H protein 8
LKGIFSAGYDEIPDRLVKQCIKLIKNPLSYIYNASSDSGIFPDRLKIAKVKPLYKKGDIHDIQNYRPISHLSLFSKILEKLMYNKLISFVTKNNILKEAQNGFREKKSTETATESFLEGIHATGIFFDLTNTYDVINHDILIDKLN